MNEAHPYMGVINVTPNSFSDGGEHNSYPKFLKAISALISNDRVSIIDVGAESTAPFNDPVSADEELKRYNSTLLTYLKSHPWPKTKILSLDTYKLEVFESLVSAILEIGPQTKVLFNDVSGIIDDGVIDLMHRYPNIHYVFCHTLVKNREKTSYHMGFVESQENSEFLKSMQNKIEQNVHIFEKEKLSDRLYLDPCFGFSKTRDQNLFLLENLESLIKAFPKSLPWIIGISRKSFLRNPDEQGKKDEDLNTRLDAIQNSYINKWADTLKKYRLFFRTHRPS